LASPIALSTYFRYFFTGFGEVNRIPARAACPKQ
jgi:hypothetical protein